MNMNSYNKMTKDEERLQKYLQVLADENRYRIILHLMAGEECVCVLADKLGLEQTLVSHHLRTLREAGLIRDRKVGRWIHCSLNRKTFEEMEKLYQKILISNKISDKSCVSHAFCRQLLKDESL